MKFVKKTENIKPYVDSIFTVVNAAKKDPDGGHRNHYYDYGRDYADDLDTLRLWRTLLIWY